MERDSTRERDKLRQETKKTVNLREGRSNMNRDKE